MTEFQHHLGCLFARQFIRENLILRGAYRVTGTETAADSGSVAILSCGKPHPGAALPRGCSRPAPGTGEGRGNVPTGTLRETIYPGPAMKYERVLPDAPLVAGRATEERLRSSWPWAAKDGIDRTMMMDAKTNGEVSFWYADIGGVPGCRKPLPGSIEADVCIIGAGFTGLWTAYYLTEAEPSLRIVVVEKEFAGFGASGRNGGWCTGEFGWNRERYLSTGSREGVIDFERQLRATVAEVKRVTEKEGIDCDFLMTDCLTFAQSPAQWDRLQADHAAAMSWQVPPGRLELIDGPEATSRIRVPNAHGALVRHNVARVQPAKLVRGLADAVERRGVRIYEQTTVTGLEKGRVITDRGTVRAKRIVRATEGFTHGIAGQRREWVPMNSAILVTEPVPDALWDQIGWDGCQLLADASHAYCYAQRTREGRIAMGGRGVPYRFGSKTDVRGQTQPATVEKLKEILFRMLPQTRGLALDHAWCGVLGVPRDWCATAGLDRETGIGWAGGYVGLGVSTSNLSGQTLADLVLDKQTGRTTLPWVNRKPRKWEVEPFRWLGIHGMYQLYHMADRQERAKGGRTTSPLAILANTLTGR